MKIVIVNGSPRSNGNTAELCDAFKNVIYSHSSENIIHSFQLNDLSFKGCQSCFACKINNGKSYGKCAYKDELSPVIDDILSADCLVVATPIYLMDATASVKALLERLCFSLGSYEQGYKSLAPKKPIVVTIYTMNCREEYAPVHAMDNIDMFLGHIFTAPHRFCAYNTYQFQDYSRYRVEVFDEKEKADYRNKHRSEEIQQIQTLARQIVARNV